MLTKKVVKLIEEQTATGITKEQLAAISEINDEGWPSKVISPQMCVVLDLIESAHSAGMLIGGYKKEEHEKLIEENKRLQEKCEHVSGLYTSAFGEIAELKNKIRWLENQVAGKPMTEREELLLRVAKEVVQYLDK